MFDNKNFKRLFYIYTAASFLIAVLSFFYLDKPSANYFHGLSGSSVEVVFDFITEYGEGFYWIVYPGALYLIYRLSMRVAFKPVWLREVLEKNREYRMQSMAFIASTAIASGLLVNILKLIFARYRPVEYLVNDNYGFNWFEYGYRMASFPSGHSATALGVASALALLFPKYLLPILATGVLIMFSRIVVAAHYPSDVVMGGFVGVITTLFLYQKYFKQRLSG